MKIKKSNWKRDKLRKKLVPFTIILIMLIGVLFQQLMCYFQSSSLGRTGKLVNINNVDMHLYEAGSGDFTFVFAGNVANTSPYSDLYLVHNKLTNTNKVMVYDKPGYGWSDCTSAERDIDTICSEIHELLHSNEDPDDEDTFLKPFIYVAYGTGSLEAIRYAQLYPDDVAGIVFIDGVTPSSLANYNNIMIVEAYLLNVARNTGILRILGGSEFVYSAIHDNPELPDRIRKINKGLNYQKLWNRNLIAERKNIAANATTTLNALGEDKLGDLPIAVVSSVNNNTVSSWDKVQSSLLTLSTDSTQYKLGEHSDVIREEDLPVIIQALSDLKAHVIELNEDL